VTGSARDGGAKKDKAKDTKKSGDAGKRSAPKTRSKSRKSGE